MSMRFTAGDKIKQVATWGRYLDQWSRKDGRWGIDKRIAIIDFDEVREVTSMRASSAGRRDKTDPSYSVLKGQR